MSDEAKLGLVAGILAVVGVAAFALPRDGHAPPKAETGITNTTTSPTAAKPSAPTTAIPKD